MRWTEQDFFGRIQKELGLEEAALVSEFITALKNEGIFSIRCGNGPKFPSIQILEDNISSEQQIVGIETFKNSNKQPGIEIWVSLAQHEDNHPRLIKEMRNFLEAPIEAWKFIKAESLSELLDKTNSVLDLVRSLER